MEFSETVRELLSRIDEAENLPDELPDGARFLDGDTVLCRERTMGDARYPYSAGGFNLWAYASGYISVNESTFYVILHADEGKEPYLGFYAGLKEKGAEDFAPISLLGVARSPLEGKIKRYTVFTPHAVYYLTREARADFCVRALVTEDKTVCFSLLALPKTDVQLYLSAYFNCFLMHGSAESNETKWFKQCVSTADGFEFTSVEDLDRTTHLDHYALLTRSLSTPPAAAYHTTARSDFTGGTSRNLSCAAPLVSGKFAACKRATKFTDTAVAGDLIHFDAAPGRPVRLDYRLSLASCGEGLAALRSAPSVSPDVWLGGRIRAEKAKKTAGETIDMRFSGSRGPLGAETFERFVGFVVRQVEFAALSKNSGVSLLGVRDVFQQLEAALMWTGDKCRAKIVEALGFIGRDGRPPRQYSIPPAPDVPPQMDLRAFIDQGVWIIDTLYRYLAYTGDATVLTEPCGYYDFCGGARRAEEQTTVLEHLVRITAYLVSHLDPETDCLHALYGDWNDALDGMGISLDGSAEFGTGVSVMASLQLYHNLYEMEEILRLAGRPELFDTRAPRARLESGLRRFAIQSEGGKRRILHGWGDKRSYLVGSSRDPDGRDRVGLTASAFWVIAGAYGWDKSIKPDILAAFDRLDSKYGLRTFDPAFAPGTPGVGRIGNLPAGTAENCATYVHATMFGIWSLFLMGESGLAWEQLYKVLPITHKHISTTQFVMSNSYSYNEEFGMDGESMSDWYTGSANVLIKVLVRCAFGLDACLDGVRVRPAGTIPFDKASLSVRVRGCLVTVNYEKRGGPRSFFVGGQPGPALVDSVSGEAFIEIGALLGADTLTVTVTD